MSAPSAINTEFATVKFENDTIEWNNMGTSQVKSAMSHRFVWTIIIGACVNFSNFFEVAYFIYILLLYNYIHINKAKLFYHV